MKKVLSVLLALSMLLAVLALAACGETEKPTDSSATPTESESPEGTGTTAPEDTEKQTVSETVPSEPETSQSETETQQSETEPQQTETEPQQSETSQSEPETSQSGEETSDNQYSITKADDYADLDFAGKTFTIVYRWSPPSIVPSGWGMTFDCYIDEDNPDDAMSAAVKLRNSSMESFYNCKIVGVPSTNPQGDARTAVQGGDATYDLCIAPYAINSYCRGEFYNVLSLINKDYDCWDQSLIRDLALGGKLYGMAGDCTTADDDYTWAIYFNKAILRDNNLEDPYQLVLDGKWTLSKMFEMARVCKKDLTGDNVIDSTRDIRGLVARAETCRFFWQGAGVRIFSAVQDDGNVRFSAGDLGIEANVYADAIAFLNDECTGGFRPEPSTGSRLGYPDDLVRSFTGGHCAFMIEGLYVTTKSALDETDGIGDVIGLEWGLLPCPKYTEDQTQYYNFVWTQASFIGVPTTLNLATASNFLNVYGLATQATVQKAFNNNVAYAYSNDENVAKMLDIIYTTRVWDASYWYASASIDNNLVSDCGSNKNRWASRIKAGQSTAEKAVAEIYGYHTNNQY